MVDTCEEHGSKQTVPELPIEVHFLQGFINDEKNIKTPDRFFEAVADTKSRQLVLSVYDLPKLCAEVLAAAHEVEKEWRKQRAKEERKARAERLQLTDQRQH